MTNLARSLLNYNLLWKEHGKSAMTKALTNKEETRSNCIMVWLFEIDRLNSLPK